MGARGRAPAGLVWTRYLRPALWSTWSPQIVSVDYPGEQLAAGSGGTVHGWLGLRVGFTVDEVDLINRAWSWTVRLPLGVRLALRHTVSADGAGSRTGLVVDGPLPVVLAYAPLARIALQKLVTPSPTG